MQLAIFRWPIAGPLWRLGDSNLQHLVMTHRAPCIPAHDCMVLSKKSPYNFLKKWETHMPTGLSTHCLTVLAITALFSARLAFQSRTPPSGRLQQHSAHPLEWRITQSPEGSNHVLYLRKTAVVVSEAVSVSVRYWVPKPLRWNGLNFNYSILKNVFSFCWYKGKNNIWYYQIFLNLFSNFFCDFGRIRTFDLCIRSALLYPAELRSHCSCNPFNHWLVSWWVFIRRQPTPYL